MLLDVLLLLLCRLHLLLLLLLRHTVLRLFKICKRLPRPVLA